MLDDIYRQIRGLAAMGIVNAADDSGEVQTVTVTTADGAVRADVEVMQIFGFASMPPAAGAICLLLAVGADPATLRALPIACPAARFGALAPGDACIYAPDGSRVHIRQNGAIEIWAGSTLTINAPNVAINGKLSADRISIIPMPMPRAHHRNFTKLTGNPSLRGLRSATRQSSLFRQPWIASLHSQ